jgi:hypothetical protein
MARTPSKTSTTEWGTYLRTHRLATVKPKTAYRGDWPFSQAEYAAQINEHLERKISVHSYIRWELGQAEPKPETMKLVKQAIESANEHIFSDEEVRRTNLIEDYLDFKIYKQAIEKSKNKKCKKDIDNGV